MGRTTNLQAIVRQQLRRQDRMQCHDPEGCVKAAGPFAVVRCGDIREAAAISGMDLMSSMQLT
jgi:hypothetical protein